MSIQEILLSITEKMGLISGKLSYLAKDIQTEALIALMMKEAFKTSKIEGEYLSRPDIRSSIKHKLGLTKEATRVHDNRAQGVVDMMFDGRPLINLLLRICHFIGI